MATSAVKLIFKSYQLLNREEKRELYKLIKEEQGTERMDKISCGEAVEHMSEFEETMLTMVRDLRKNIFYYKPE